MRTIARVNVHFLIFNGQIMSNGKKKADFCKANAIGTFYAYGMGESKRNTTMNNETLMSAEEFFRGLEPESSGKTPARKGRSRGKKTKSDIFAELKVKMVMRIYGVSKARALKIIVGRAAEKRELERKKDKTGKKNDCGGIPVEEFFGA